MLLLYRLLTTLSAPLLAILLWHRVRIGKEDPKRLSERKGISPIPRPEGQLIWLHAASVGEAQSALILIDRIKKEKPDASFLVTSGTRTSADLMAKRLPEKAIHQYYPLDRNKWVKNFINHWQPDLALLMESELWPNMLRYMRKKRIPTILVNGRLSLESFRRWKMFKNVIEKILRTFDLILAQTESDAKRFEKLGAKKVIVLDNLKHSAAPLPYNKKDLEELQNAIGNHPLWVYASTHDGEETLATRIHQKLKEKHKNLLTIIVPRHPERRNEIETQCKGMGVKVTLRSENKEPANDQTDIYIADTLGELGLFYRLSNIAMIGRSFSNDGGGGHNPIEAAQLDCAVLTGPNIQFQLQLFDEMIAVNAAKKLNSEQELLSYLDKLLNDQTLRDELIKTAQTYAQSKGHIIEEAMVNIKPFLSTKKKKWYNV